MPATQPCCGGMRLQIESPRPVIVILAIALAVIYAVMEFIPPAGEFLVTWFAFNTGEVFGRWRLWQFVTALFLHGSMLHLIGNLLFFYFFGNGLAHAWRRSELLRFMLVCGVVANLAFWLFHVISGDPAIGLGASGVIFGLMGAYAIVYANRILLLFFIIPMPVRVFVAICVIIEALLFVSMRQDGVSHIAHLAGLLVGILYVKLVHRRQDRLAGAAGKAGSAGGRLRGLEVMGHDS